jgi:hypothetical protein
MASILAANALMNGFIPESDGPFGATGAKVTPRDAWAALRRLLPLTDAEFRAIASNVPPYMQ